MILLLFEYWTPILSCIQKVTVFGISFSQGCYNLCYGCDKGKEGGGGGGLNIVQFWLTGSFEVKSK